MVNQKINFNFRFLPRILSVIAVFLALPGITALTEMNSNSHKSLHSLSESFRYRSRVIAAMVCKLIEKRASYGNPIGNIYLNDVILWGSRNEKYLNGCIVKKLQNEIRIYLPENNICIRYYDPLVKNNDKPAIKANEVVSKIRPINSRLYKQIIYFDGEVL